MDRTNVTVSLPSDIVREARHAAVNEGLSLSRYLARLLEERVESIRRYNEARERHQRLMERGLNLGTEGKKSWSREELHER